MSLTPVEIRHLKPSRAFVGGYDRVYDGDTTARSRSMIALAFGPGSGVLMSGANIESLIASVLTAWFAQ